MTTYAENRKARFNYHILERMEAGMVLTGGEVKAIRSGRISLSGAHISVKKGDPYLINCNISPYQPKNTPLDYDPRADRKLLLNKKEVRRLAGRTEEKGVTAIPLRVYEKNNLLKLEIGLVKGKKKRDKREEIKRREVDRRIERIIKSKGKSTGID